jgi:rubrerythrin
MKLATEQEYEAYQLYKDIAEHSGDPELRAIFEQMASEELKHRDVIMKRYNKLRELAD